MPTVFLDTSVVIAACLSSRGPAHAIFDLARLKRIIMVVTESVILEAYGVMQRKYPRRTLEIVSLFQELRDSIKPSASSKDIAQFSAIISDPKDCHILAGAQKYHADTLITHDRRHFFTPAIQAAKLKFRIESPREFLTRYYQELG